MCGNFRNSCRRETSCGGHLPLVRGVFQSFGGTKLSYNVCSLDSWRRGAEYLTGRRWRNISYLWKGAGHRACAEELLDYLEFVKSLHKGASLRSQRVSGGVRGTRASGKKSVCAAFFQYRSVCGNNVHRRKWTAIDYEWSFYSYGSGEFYPLPIIFYFTDHDWGEEFKSFDLYGKMGITSEECKA